MLFRLLFGASQHLVILPHRKLLCCVTERVRPCGPDHSAQQGPLLFGAELHNARCLKLLPDPLALLHIIDEHELHANMLTVGCLKEKEEIDHLQTKDFSYCVCVSLVV